MSPGKRARWWVSLFLGLLAACSAHGAGPPRHFFLELDIANERGGATALLFDFGDGFWGENSVAAEVPAGSTPRTVRLRMPDRPIRDLRFDPTPGDELVLITGLRLVDDRGAILLRLDPRRLRPMANIASIVPEGDGVRVRPSAVDPMLRLDLEPLQKKLHDASQRPTVGRGTIVALALLLATLLVGSVWIAWRALGHPAPASTAASSNLLGYSALGRRDGKSNLLGYSAWGGAALFAVVLGARLWSLHLFSRAVPFWDEWEGDVLYVLIPFAGGFFDWGALVMPQWEHRILLTRFVTLFGTVLNGEWDPRVAMTVSAAMFSAMIALVGTALLATRTWIGTVAALGISAGACLPFDFNNLLWGGQTQMYGLLLMAVCTIALASAPDVTPAVRWAAAGGGLLSVFTMGAGPLGPACAVGISLVRSFFEKDQRRPRLGLAAIFFGAALLGVFLHTNSRAHVGFYATSFAQFQRAFVGALSWPLSPGIASATLLWAPWIVNGVLILRRRGASSLEWLAVGLGGWALVNAIALGYARQYEGPPFDSRFFTSFTLGALASVCSCAALLLRAATWPSRLALLAAGSVVAAGLIVAGVKGIGGARENRAMRGDMETRIRTFLSAGDRAPVLEKPPHFGPFGMNVADRLESPLLQPLLPAAYRRAIAQRTPERFPAPIDAGPVSIAVRTLMKGGPVIALLGILGLALFLRRLPPLPGLWMTRRVPSVAGPPSREARFERGSYVAVVLLTLGWVALYSGLRRDGLVDEGGHAVNIHHFHDRLAGWPEAMPMLPGYHFVVLSIWRLHPDMAAMTAARITSALLALVGFAAFALAWRKIHGKPAGRATLLFALLPLTQPFTGMAYTDAPALALALCAFWAQLSGRPGLAVLALLLGTGMRQTTLVWAGFIIAWEFLRTDEPRRTFLRRTGWMFGLLALAVITVATTGRLTVGTQHGNDFRFNPATLHFTGALVLVLGLPFWIGRAPAAWRWVRERARVRPALAVTAGAMALGAATALAVSFANPHIWNRELFWEGCSFTLLRNWPLVWIDSHAWLKALSGINIVLMAAGVAAVVTTQRQRHALWLALACGVVPVVTNSLIEPRYLIPLAGFVLLFLELERNDWRRLAVWWALLTAVHAPFVVKALSLW